MCILDISHAQRALDRKAEAFHLTRFGTGRIDLPRAPGALPARMTRELSASPADHRDRFTRLGRPTRAQQRGEPRHQGGSFRAIAHIGVADGGDYAHRTGDGIHDNFV